MESIKKFFLALGAILAAIGAFLLLRKNDTPAKVQELEAKVNDNNSQVVQEQAKQQEIIKQAEQEKAKDVTGEELANDLTNRLNKH